MRCKIGVHTETIELGFTEHDYANLRMLIPVKKNARSWMVMERDGGVLLERSSVGRAPTRIREHPDEVRLANEAGTVVRCCTHERELEFIRAGQGFIRMPPHHLWPWMRDSHARLKAMTIDRWRWHLVQELNARVRSATRGLVDFPVDDLPAWVRSMLTVDEIARLTRNEGLAR
jgi:hypothetical protein